MAKKILCGLTVVLCGVLVLLGNIGVINFYLNFDIIWPIVLLLFVVGNIMDNKRIDMGSIIFLLIGFYFLLRNLDIITISFWQIIFPVLLILLGIGIMLPKKDIDGENLSDNLKTTKNDIMLNAIFSGAETKSESKDLKKIESTAIFGSTKVDLRKASTKDGKCVMYATSVFGGVDVILSDDWEVNTDGVTCILGGVENKHDADSDRKAKNTLYIQGLSIFGGIDIK